MGHCSNFIDWLGSASDFEDKNFLNYYDNEENYEWAIAIRATNKIICIFFLLIIFFYCLFYRCLFKKRLQSSLKLILKSTIFSFLDDLPDEKERQAEKRKSELFPNAPPEKIKCEIHIEIQKKSSKEIKSRLVQDGISIPSSDYDRTELKKELEVLKKQTESYEIEKESNQIYLCDFNECCCSCWCDMWRVKVYEKMVRPCFQKIAKSIQHGFKRNLKFFCFYFLILGPFIYNPLREVFTLFFNHCAVTEINKYVLDFLYLLFLFVDLFCGSMTIMLYVFIISFLNTRMELLRIYFVDKTYRANLMYYHLNKGLYFAGLFCCFKLAYKTSMLFLYACYDMMEGPYSVLWLFFKSVLLLSLIKFSNSMNNESIKENCKMLRAHARYFVLQNALLKQIPKADYIYHIIKKEVKKKEKDGFSINGEDNLFESLKKMDLVLDIERFFAEKIKHKCRKVERNLRQELKIIESQKFRNVLRNKGYLRYLPCFFIVFFTFFNVIQIFDSIVLLIKYEVSTEIVAENIVTVGVSIASFVECSVLPVLIFYCVRKSTVKKSR